MSTPTSDDTFDRFAHSFGAVAATYERGRPGYPVEAARWVLPSGATRVVDLGAGTGKFTRVLTPLVETVIAVEPDAGMRAQLEVSVPGVPVLEGSGESIPVEDGSVDAVVVAQAWHWMDPERTALEVARVLRPGGMLGLVWNIRDESVPWVARMSEILHAPERVSIAESPRVGPPFGALERHDVAWVHEQTRDAFLDDVRSRSYVSTLAESERQEILDRIVQLLDTTPELAGRATVPVPYITQCSRTVRP